MLAAEELAPLAAQPVAPSLKPAAPPLLLQPLPLHAGEGLRLLTPSCFHTHSGPGQQAAEVVSNPGSRAGGPAAAWPLPLRGSAQLREPAAAHVL